MAGLEPVFTPGRPVWPLAGSVLSSLEPADPDLAIPHGSVEIGRREAHHRHIIRDQSIRIAELPAEALVPPGVTRIAGARRKWSAAIVASCVFHAAVASVFVYLAATEEVPLMEGSDFSGIALLGSAPDDQVSAGEETDRSDPQATSVTMVTMLQAKPVEMLDAEAVVVETVDTVEAQPVEVAAVERTQPVHETEVQQPITAERPTTALAERAEPVRPEQQATAVEPDAQAAPVAASRLAPDILATDRPEIVQDSNTVQKSVDAVQAEPVEPNEAMPVRPVETVLAERIEPSHSEPVHTDKAIEAESELVVKAKTEMVEKLPEQVVRPEPKPVEVAQEAPTPVKPAEDKPVEKKIQKKPAKQARTPDKPVDKPAEKPVKQATRAGSVGRNQTDTRRGQVDGKENGDSAQASRGGSKNGEVGNAAVSNYPGKVRQKLARMARSSRASQRGNVVVSFVVTASGGVRAVSASGNPGLQAEALKVVNRAAPFPPIPAGAGRSSWEFNIPLTFAGR